MVAIVTSCSEGRVWNKLTGKVIENESALRNKLHTAAHSSWLFSCPIMPLSVQTPHVSLSGINEIQESCSSAPALLPWGHMVPGQEAGHVGAVGCPRSRTPPPAAARLCTECTPSHPCRNERRKHLLSFTGGRNHQRGETGGALTWGSWGEMARGRSGGRP